jgi:hypothetical protein
LLGGEGGLNDDDVMDEIDLLGKEKLIRSKVIKMPLIEREHVQQLYDAIAPNWHGTRYKAWPQVEAFIEVMCVWTSTDDNFIFSFYIYIFNTCVYIK